MTQQNQGHYAKKHTGKEILIEENFREHLLAEAKEGTITCVNALWIAEESGKGYQQTGIYLDLLEIRITECQLGLFGFMPEKRIVKKTEIIDPEMQQLIEKERKNGGVSCAFLLKIAG